MIKNLSSDSLLKLSTVLFDIKHLVLYAKEGESVIYPSDENLNSPPLVSSLTSQEQRFFVFTLQSENAIKVLHEHTLGRRETPFRWTLEGKMTRLNELDSEILQIIKDLLTPSSDLGLNEAKKSHEPVNNIYKPSEPPPNLIEWRNLVLDLNQQTICYKNSVPHEFSFETLPLRLLLLLFDHPRVLEYVEIAQRMNLNCYHEHVKNDDVAREVQAIRRDLINILKNTVKMEAKDLADLIVSKEKVGYKVGKE